MYSRLQHISVLSLRCSVLSVGQVVVDHGVDQITELLLFSGAVKLRVDLKNTCIKHTSKLIYPVHSGITLIKLMEKIVYANISEY